MYSDNAVKSTANKEFVRPDRATVRAKKREIAIRYRNGKRDPKRRFSMATQRVSELRKLFLSRYGNELPDDDSGRDDAKLMIDHIAACRDAIPAHVETFLRQWCPWLGANEIEKLTADAMAKPLRYRADTLAERLGVTDAERTKLKLRTIGAIDLAKAEREARRRERSAERSRRYRARNRTMTRAQYEANSLSRTKPWEAEGISRSTWERHRKARDASTERTILSFSKRDGTCVKPQVSRPAAPLLSASAKGRNDLARQSAKPPLPAGQVSRLAA